MKWASMPLARAENSSNSVCRSISRITSLRLARRSGVRFAAAAHDDYTGSFLNIQCYDGLKVNAILNEIDGKNHDGTVKTKVPSIFGMNFQAVSIGQKQSTKNHSASRPADCWRGPQTNGGGPALTTGCS